MQVLNEFAAVLRRKFRLEWDLIADALADVREALGPVRPIDVDPHLRAVDLARSHDFSFHDALIVASASRRRLRHPADRGQLQAGRRIAGLTIVNPFA